MRDQRGEAFLVQDVLLWGAIELPSFTCIRWRDVLARQETHGRVRSIGKGRLVMRHRGLRPHMFLVRGGRSLIVLISSLDRSKRCYAHISTYLVAATRAQG